MKKVLMAAAAMVLVAGAAVAGPNAGGTLIVAESVGTAYTSDVPDYCGSSTTSACESASVNYNGADGTLVLNIIAAFAPSASPRLAGVTFGIAYDNALYAPAAFAHCGDFELPDGTWPADGSGTAVTWGAAQTGTLTEVYWTAHYAYASYGPGTLSAIANPVQGGNFADDDVPANVDPIAGYGAFGFFATTGLVACPIDEAPVACCFVDGSCTLEFPDDCLAAGGNVDGSASCNPNPCPPPAIGACCIGDICVVLPAGECDNQGGTFQGDGTTCDPDPCVPVPTFETTWGAIKATNR